jgi:hypothetical protein
MRAGGHQKDSGVLSGSSGISNSQNYITIRIDRVYSTRWLHHKHNSPGSLLQLYSRRYVDLDMAVCNEADCTP